MKPAAAEDNLKAIKTARNRLTDVPDIPETTLQIIEYSLGSHRKAELYVSRLLAYFLDPSKPHGFDADFLAAFLDACLDSDAAGVAEDTLELADARVITESPISRRTDEDEDDADQVRGYVDLFIEMPDEWFVIIELKFGTTERGIDRDGLSQTELYYAAEAVNGTSKEEYDREGYYLYIRPSYAAGAQENEFTTLAWRDITAVIDSFLDDHAARLPARSTRQLREFTDDIKILTGMSDQAQYQQDLAELYVEYFKTVESVTSAFDEQWEEFLETWWQQLSAQFQETRDLSIWHGREGEDRAYIFKDGWWRRADTLDPINAQGDYNTLRIGFHHRMRRHLDTALADHKLRFYFRNPGGNLNTEFGETNFRDIFNDEFDEREETIEATLPPAASLTGNLRNLTEATYEIPVSEYDDFRTAYLKALERAFREHALENEKLVRELDSIYETCLNVIQE